MGRRQMLNEYKCHTRIVGKMIEQLGVTLDPTRRRSDRNDGEAPEMCVRTPGGFAVQLRRRTRCGGGFRLYFWPFVQRMKRLRRSLRVALNPLVLLLNMVSPLSRFL